MKTIPTCNNEFFMETLYIENYNNLKNISRRAKKEDNFPRRGRAWGKDGV
jgi:hypothetical protein